MKQEQEKKNTGRILKFEEDEIPLNADDNLENLNV